MIRRPLAWVIPFLLVVLTAGYTAENIRMSQIAGCDAIYPKPLTAQLAREIAGQRASFGPPALDSEDLWLRSWLVREGEQLLKVKQANPDDKLPALTSKELTILLKALSGKGWQAPSDATMAVLAKCGGSEQARGTLEQLLPQLEHPYGSFLQHMLNNASIAETSGIGGLTAYVAAKHGVVGLTRAAALAHAGDGIRVNALVTGNVDTPLYRELLGAGPDVDRAALSAPNPTGRVAGPEEIAAFVAFLLGDEARFVTGAILAVDGGATAG